MKKKILVCMPSMNYSDGIAKFYFNYYDQCLKNFKIDFYILSDSIDVTFKNRLEKDTKIYIMKKCNKFNQFFVMYKDLNKILKDSEYDLIHINLVDISSYVVTLLSKKYKIKSIFHAHNPMMKGTSSSKIIRNYFTKRSISLSNCFFASSYETGLSCFNKLKFKIINNLVDFEKFQYNSQNRNYIRKTLGLKSDEVIVGTIGRIEEQKNPFFIADFVKELNKKINMKLIWIGNGSLYEKINSYCKKNEINNILFLGNCPNVNEYYSAFDIFILPSLFEGLGIVLLESQASGLPTLTSTNVPKDTNITDLIQYISVNDGTKCFVKQFMKIYKVNLQNRKKYNEICKNSKYSIRFNNILNNEYIEILKDD